MANNPQSALAPLTDDEYLNLYRRMVLIRECEERVIRLVSQNRIPGTIHPYVGQEAIAVGVCASLNQDDFIASTHRGHGHMLAKGGEAKFLLAELYGKATGYCHGKGGSMHVATIEHGMIGANAIIGANSPMVGGAALGFQMMGSSRVAVSFVGDGAIDTGGLHEALSLAALWNVPAIFVLENNGFTEFVARKDLQRAETIVGRAAAYGIPAISVNGNDVEEVALQARLAIDRARSGEGPTFIEATTYRLRGHFVGDPELYRTPEEVEEHRAGEPLVLAEQKLRERGVIDDQLVSDILKEVSETVDEAVQFAEESPYPDPEDALDGVYTNLSVTGWEQQT